MADRSIKVTLRADVQDFKNQFDQASKAADQVGKSTEDAARKSKGVFGELKQSAQDNRQAWTTAGTALTGFGAAILGVGAMAAKTGVAYNQLQQRAGSALEVLMGSAEGAAEQMARLNEFADTSPFSREVFIEAQQQLIAFGIEAESVVPILSAVQDAVAATGGSNADIAELVNIIAKVGSTGKITAQNLNELGYRGVDAATLIGEQMGKTGEEIRSEITAGTLDADAAIQALTDGMSEKFGGAAAGMKETFDGAIDRLKAAWRDLSAELMTPLVSPDGGGLLVDLTNRAADALRLFQSLPGPVKGATAAIGGLTGAASLGAGAFLLLLPRAIDTIGAFNTLRRDLPRTTAALGGLAKSAGIAAAALVGLNVISSITESYRDAAADVDQFESSLRNLHQTGEITTSAVNDLASSTVPFGVSVRGIGDALDLIDPDPVSAALEGLTNIVLGVPTTADVASESLGSLDQALASLAREGSMDELSAAFQAAVQDAEQYGYTAADLVAELPELSTAFTDVATNMGLQADEATILKLIMREIEPVFDEATGAIVGLADSTEEAAAALEKATEASNKALDGLLALGGAFLDARDAAREYEDSLKDANEAAKENGKHWEDGTEAARANAEAIDGLSESVLNNADKMRSNGEAAGKWLEGQREDLIDVAMQMGATREEAEKYVDQLGLTPEKIDTQIELDTTQALEKWSALWDELGYNPPQVPVGADTDPAKESVTEFEGTVMNGTPPEVPVGADTSGAKEEVDGFGAGVGDTPTTPLDITSNIQPAMAEVLDLEDAINASGGTVEINGNSIPGDQVLDTLMGIINSSDGTVTIDGQSYPADEALAAAIRAINNGEGTVEIDGDNSGANSATNSAVSHANRSSGSIKVGASTGSAERAINHAARTRRTTIVVGYSDPGFKGSGGASRFATGGPVYGPGTETSDSIPAQLSNNEHVFAAREVKAAGGHQAIYSIRQQLMAGAKTIHLATGGAADGSVGAVQAMPYMQAQGRSSGPVTVTLDGAALGALATAVRTGASQATIGIDDRQGAGLLRRWERTGAK